MTSGGHEPGDAPFPSGWLAEAQRSQRARLGRHDRFGTANYIDAAARRRAAASVTSGEVVSLARPVVNTGSVRRDGRPTAHVKVFVADLGGTQVATDHVELDIHGVDNTHLDALNHIRLGNEYYGGWAADDPACPSAADLGGAGLFTRAVLVDVPTVRGRQWVPEDEPVTGDDLDRGLGLAGTALLPGDALLLYMGRDRYERAGHVYRFSSPSAGLGEDGARWITRHQISLLCWDFLDALVPGPPMPNAHSLIWATGQLLVDNCDFAALKRCVGSSSGVVGALVVAPMALPGATGCGVNPLVLR